jgi:hypothetical protein
MKSFFLTATAALVVFCSMLCRVNGQCNIAKDIVNGESGDYFCCNSPFCCPATDVDDCPIDSCAASSDTCSPVSCTYKPVEPCDITLCGQPTTQNCAITCNTRTKCSDPNTCTYEQPETCITNEIKNDCSAYKPPADSVLAKCIRFKCSSGTNDVSSPFE